MEMHSRASLHAIHGIDVNARAPLGFRTWVARLLKRVAEAERRRRDFEILSAKDDHQLCDIGLTRADVLMLRNGTWQPRPGLRR